MKHTANQKIKPSECVWTRDFLLLSWCFTAKQKACRKVSRNKDWIVQDIKCFHVFLHAHIISNIKIISVNANLFSFCIYVSQTTEWVNDGLCFRNCQSICGAITSAQRRKSSNWLGWFSEFALTVIEHNMLQYLKYWRN